MHKNITQKDYTDQHKKKQQTSKKHWKQKHVTQSFGVLKADITIYSKSVTYQ